MERKYFRFLMLEIHLSTILNKPSFIKLKVYQVFNSAIYYIIGYILEPASCKIVI